MHGRFRAIVGHSFGGLAALTAARDGVTTASVATIAGAGSAGGVPRGVRASDGPRRAARAQSSRLPSAAGSARTRHPSTRRYDAIAHPLPEGIDLLVAHDERDRQLSAGVVAQRLYEAHRERARLVTTDGFGHARILGADPVLDAVVGLATGGLVGVDRALEPAAARHGCRRP